MMKSFTTAITKALFVAAVLAVAGTNATGQDPVKVDGTHYKVEFENDRVRVLRVNYGPKEKSVMHGHPDSVVVALTDTQSKFTLAGGKSEDRAFKAGETLWTPAGNHMPENVGGKPMQVILVELKDGPAAGSMPAATDDPVKVSAKHHKLEFENDRVRVLRGIIGPHEITGMHGHPANIVIFLTDVNVKATVAGKAEDAKGKAGQVSWREPLKHDSENMSDQPLEVVIVELKGK